MLRFILLFTAGIGWAQAAPAPGASVVDRVMAVVNDDVITEQEVRSRLPMVRAQLVRQNVRLPAEDVLLKRVLERMIVERLQVQVAQRLGIAATEERVDAAVQKIAQDNGMDVAKFRAALAQDGVGFDEFRQQVANQVTIQQLLEREIHGRIQVSDAEIAALIERQRNAGDAAVEYHLSHILIAVPETATPEAIAAGRAKATEVLAKLKAGVSFEQLAVASSQDPNALEGGVLGWRRGGQLPTLFLDAVRGLREGETTDVLKSANGFHILKLNQRRGVVDNYPVPQTHVRHILLRPNELVSVAEAERRLRRLRERIEQGEDFAALAKANSDDFGSSALGGDIGWVRPGQTAREFERAMNDLAVGEISKPVRSPFGVHLIQVLARREQDMSEERNRLAARNQIHARKADERYEQWLRQLRDEAFVEYRLE